MMPSLYFFVPFALLAALLCNIGIWAPRRVGVKVAALAVAALFMPVSYAAVVDLLSRPKPASLEWVHRNLPHASVLGASVKEGEAIYLWLTTPEMGEPRAYRLPWSREMAQQLQNAQREAQRNHGGVRVRRPFGNDEDRRERMFYAPPQPPLPPKPPPEAGNGGFVLPSRAPRN